MGGRRRAKDERPADARIYVWGGRHGSRVWVPDSAVQSPFGG